MMRLISRAFHRHFPRVIFQHDPEPDDKSKNQADLRRHVILRRALLLSGLRGGRFRCRWRAEAASTFADLVRTAGARRRGRGLCHGGPDPAYHAPRQSGTIGCTTLVNAVSTGAIYTATRWGLSEWRISPAPTTRSPCPAPATTRSSRATSWISARAPPVGNVRDAVNVFLSARPGSNASQFGGVDPPIDVPERPEGPDSILSDVPGTDA